MYSIIKYVTQRFALGTPGAFLAKLLRMPLGVAALVIYTLLAHALFAAEKPNVVLIMTDDQGWGDVHAHGNEKIDTPAMDRLAAEGAQFERFFMSPMCGPTRASLLTGRWNLRSGASWVSHGKEIVRLNEVTIGEAMKAAGYATGAFGKWHNGEYGPYHPNDRGFDQFVGFCRGAWENYFDAEIEENRQSLKTRGYITDVLTDAALDFIEKNRDRPFFCYIPFNAPHHPYQVPEKYLSKYLSRGFEERTAAVYGMVENIDDNLVRLLAKLDELSLSENTIVIFTSDNGPTGPLRFNGGMRGQKATVDEGGVRVPFFIRWSEHIQPGIRVTPIAAHIDVFPTLVELCGIPMPKTLPQDGRSLVPLLMGSETAWTDRMLFAHQNQYGDTLPTPGSVRTQRYRLVDRGNGYQLYDMILDPGQERDIAKEKPQVTQRLAVAYDAWYAEVTSQGVTPPPLPVGYPSLTTTALQGEDSTLSGGLKFRRGIGWAHDSIINWKPLKDTVTWTVDVQESGVYEIALMYGCHSEDLGTIVRTEMNGQQVESVIQVARDPMPSDKNAQDRKRVRTSGPIPRMTWHPLEAGRFYLEKGPTRLVVRLMDTKGRNFELKEARIRQVN